MKTWTSYQELLVTDKHYTVCDGVRTNVGEFSFAESVKFFRDLSKKFSRAEHISNDFVAC